MAEPHQLPQVVHLKRKDGRVVQDCSVYIARACYRGGWKLPQSVWHNPFSASKLGREVAIAEYRCYILTAFTENPVLWTERLVELSEVETLGCWCKPLDCHGDVLVNFLGRYFARFDALTAEHVAELAREMLGE